MTKWSWSNFRDKVHDILEPGADEHTPSRWFDYFVMTLIGLSVTGVAFLSFKALDPTVKTAVGFVELFTAVVFTLEYGLRIWTADLKFPDAKIPILAFIKSTYSLTDLMAILPIYVPLFFPGDASVAKLCTMLLLLRIFKLARYSKAVDIIIKVVKKEKQALLATLMIIMVTVFIASCLVYFAENDAQPDKFTDIPTAFWWGIVTLTTVGYGDVFPITLWGKIVGGFLAISGIFVVALPVGIMSAGFLEEIKRSNKVEDEKSCKCPHCGKEIEN